MWLSVVSLYVTLFMAGGDFARPVSHQKPDRRGHAGFSADGHLPEPPTMVVRVGDPVPNFAFEGYDRRWMRLHHFLDQGPVLLVFGAREAELRRIQAERELLLDLGVIPVVVLDAKPNTTRSLVKRFGLQYTVLSDPRGVIAGQFNLLESRSVVPGWFVLDRRGKVRGLLRGELPPGGYPRVCARALALPMPGVALPGRSR